MMLFSTRFSFPKRPCLNFWLISSLFRSLELKIFNPNSSVILLDCFFFGGDKQLFANSVIDLLEQQRFPNIYPKPYIYSENKFAPIIVCFELFGG